MSFLIRLRTMREAVGQGDLFEVNMHVRARRRIEFGDFQTPIALARAICSLVARSGFSPASILEPTCGTGAFLTAALETFPAVSRVLGFEINAEYVAQARRAVAGFSPPRAHRDSTVRRLPH